MQIFKRIICFIKKLFKKDIQYTDESLVKDEKIEEDINDDINTKEISLDEDFAFVEKNNIIDSINLLRTKLSRIEFVCKPEFLEFSKKLDYLENLCYSEYDEYIRTIREGKLAFTCDPKFNGDIKNKIRYVQIEIEDFIEKVGKYKILQDRIEKLTSELNSYYDEYKTGKFKGDFLELIGEAKLTLKSVLKRIIGDKDISQTIKSSDFLCQKALNDTYMYLLYLIEKCTIFYQIKNNCFSILEVKQSFKECFLIFLMKDLEDIKTYIKTLKGTKYYSDLISKLEKIKSVNISNIEDVLENETFFEDFVNIEDTIANLSKKMASDNIKTTTQNLLNLLKS